MFKLDKSMPELVVLRNIVLNSPAKSFQKEFYDQNKELIDDFFECEYEEVDNILLNILIGIYGKKFKEVSNKDFFDHIDTESLDKGLNVNITSFLAHAFSDGWSWDSTKHGITALQAASYANNEDAVRAFLSRGARQDITLNRFKRFETVMQNGAFDEVSVTYGLSSFLFACRNNARIATLLLDDLISKVDSDEPNDSTKTEKYNDMARHIILNSRDAQGTPLAHLVAMNEITLVKRLLDLKVDLTYGYLSETKPNKGRNIKFLEPWTPLHNACRLGFVPMVRLLLKAGAPTASVHIYNSDAPPDMDTPSSLAEKLTDTHVKAEILTEIQQRDNESYAREAAVRVTEKNRIKDTALSFFTNLLYSLLFLCLLKIISIVTGIPVIFNFPLSVAIAMPIVAFGAAFLFEIFNSPMGVPDFTFSMTRQALDIFLRKKVLSELVQIETNAIRKTQQVNAEPTSFAVAMQELTPAPRAVSVSSNSPSTASESSSSQYSLNFRGYRGESKKVQEKDSKNMTDAAPAFPPAPN